MSIAAGKLRHKVEFQEPVTSKNTAGEIETTWQHVCHAWASVEPVSAKEFVAASQVQSEVTTRITVRYRAGLTAAMRILFRGQVYDIAGLLPDLVSGIEYVTIPCSVGVNDG